MSKWLDSDELDNGWIISGDVDDNGDLELRINNTHGKTIHEFNLDHITNDGQFGSPIKFNFTTNIADTEEYGFFASQVMEIELEHLEGMLITETKPWKIELIEEQIRTLRD